MGRPKKDDAKKAFAEREEKASLFADKIINEHKTIRQVAEEYNVSKSTVHLYLKEHINSKSLQNKIGKELSHNFYDKHIRGGEATKKKFAIEREKKEKDAKKDTVKK